MLGSGSNVFAGVNSSSTDEIFVTNAARAGLAEVVDGKLAVRNGSTSAVRALGRRMVADHGRANETLASIARADALRVPTTPDASARAAIAKHGSLSGRAFDTAYLDGQIAAHRRALDLMTTEIAQGSNPRLVAFAKRTRPTVRKHLTMPQAARAAT